MDPLFFAVFLGVLHGADPGRGWLFAVYSYVLTRDRVKALLTLSALWGGHSVGVMATYLAVAPLLALRPLMAAAIAFLSVAPLIYGKLNPHGLARPWSKTSSLAASSALAGLVHGGGLALAAICGLSTWAYLTHIFSVYLVSGAMAAVFAKSLTALRRLYINFDYLYAATGVATATYLVAGFV